MGAPPPNQLHMNIQSRDIGLWQQDGVEMQLHCLTSPIPAFHPSIPHTFYVFIEYGWLPVPWITFPPGSLFFHYLRDTSPTLFLQPCHSFFLFLFTSFSLFYLALLLPLHISLILSMSHSFPSLCTGGVIGASLSSILWFLKTFISQRRESDCSIIFPISWHGFRR